jgi:hypothetical protein
MAIIYSYPTVTPVKEDLILGTDVSAKGNPTKNFTIESIIDLVTIATGDLQFVLDLGNVATGRDINLTNSAFRGGSFVTTGGATVSGTTGIGFTNITSTEFTGTIATAAQPNITSLGALTSLVLDGPISGTNLINNSNLTGAQNDNVVSTLAIKTYVDNKVGLYDTLQEILANGNTTSGSDIVVSAGDDITFTDTSKILMGTTAADNLEIYNDSTNSVVIDKSPGALKIQTSLLSIRNEADTTQTISANATGAVELYHVGDKKIETLVGGAKVTGAFQATTSGTFVDLINTGTYSDSSGDVGTAGQILSSTGTGTNWVTEVPLYNWSLEGTTIPSGTAVTVTDGTNITTTWDAANFDLTIATTGVPDGSGAANQVTYWSDADTLTGAAGFTFAGGATGKVTIGGELEVGGVLTDGTFTGSSGTYTGYTSITSTDFVGALTGNASTATALASGGAIAITGDTSSTGGPYTYTSGGAVTISTTIANTTVTAKTLLNLPTPTSAAITASDTILDAMAKLQGQITGLAGSLAFEGTWNANTDTPTLSGTTPSNGTFYIVSVAGTTDLDGITDWQVGDWAIYVDNGAGTNAWQKLDQSNEVLGSGAANKIAKWTSTNTLATGLIADDGTDVTIGNSGNLIVQGNTTLGDADTDTTTVKGPGVFEKTAQFDVGIGLSSTPDYGTAGQVLTSGGGSATANTWETLTADSLAATLSVGNTTGGTDIAITAGDKITNFTSTGIDDNATSNALTIDASQNATFAGNVAITKAQPKLTINDTTASDLQLIIQQSGSTALFQSRGGTNTTGQFIFKTTNGTTSTNALIIDQQSNATFAGNVAINDTISGNFTTNYDTKLLVGGEIIARSLTASASMISIGGDATSAFIKVGKQDGSQTARPLRIEVGTTEVMGIDSSGNATFAGSVTANTGSKITSSSTDTTFSIETTSGTTIFPILDFVSSHSTAGARIRVSGTDVISIDKSQNSTFAGNITISKATPFITLSNTAEDECGIVMLDSADAGQSAKITYDAGSSNALKFYNNAATERMRIDSSGVVTITRSFTPAASLSDITQLKIENTDTSFGGSAAGIQLDAGNGDTTGFILSRADGNDNTFEGVIIGTATDNPIIFGTNTGTSSILTNERMRITEGGELRVGHNSGTYTHPNTFAQFGNTVVANEYGASISSSGNSLSGYFGSNAHWANAAFSKPNSSRSAGYLQIVNTATSNAGSEFIFRTVLSGDTTHYTRMIIESDGSLKVPSVHSQTTGVGANVVVLSDGELLRSTSSLKYKTDVRDYDKGLNEVMQLQPKYYKGKNDESETQFAGLIAENVHDLGLTEFVQYADDGTPDALSYTNMIALLTKSIQELKADNDSLKARIETLENN